MNGFYWSAVKKLALHQFNLKYTTTSYVNKFLAQLDPVLQCPVLTNFYYNHWQIEPSIIFNRLKHQLEVLVQITQIRKKIYHLVTGLSNTRELNSKIFQNRQIIEIVNKTFGPEKRYKDALLVVRLILDWLILHINVYRLS